MKTYSFILSFFVAISFYGKGDELSIHRHSLENKIISKFYRIQYYANKIDNIRTNQHGATYNADSVSTIEDSLQQANKAFIVYLNYSLGFLDSNMLLDYKYLDTSISISTLESQDKKIRFYTWETFLGGTSQEFATIAQYKNSAGVKTQIISGSDLLEDTLNNNDSNYNQNTFINEDEKIIYENKLNGYLENIEEYKSENVAPHYIIIGSGKCDTWCVDKFLVIFKITEKGLEECTLNALSNNKDQKSYLEIQYGYNQIVAKKQLSFIVSLKDGIIDMPIISDKTTKESYRKYGIKW